jgi:hypothetical protein
MPRYFARYNVEASAWEVFDTLTQAVFESFPYRQDEELRHYAEHRALAHANRKNQEAEEKAADETGEDAAH